jgi:hypothetical protein
MRRLRLLSATVAALFFVAFQLGAQSAPEPRLAVIGDVPRPLSLSAADLDAMPREHVEVTEQDGEKTIYEGVALQGILMKAGLAFGRQMRGKALAGYVLAEAKDGYAVVSGLGELDPDLGGAKIIVADKRDGESLLNTRGRCDW